MSESGRIEPPGHADVTWPVSPVRFAIVNLKRLPAVLVMVISYLMGSIPFSGLTAWLLRRVDLRTYGTGTVSGTGLFRVAGFRPLVVGGVLDVAKGAVGPALAGLERPTLAAAAGSAAVVGHNWSIFLRGAGGRGISPAMGSMLVTGWPGSAYMLGSLILGKALQATSLGAFCGFVTLPTVMSRARGSNGSRAAWLLVIPMLAKRVLGNQPLPARGRAQIAATRLLFDQDTPAWPRLRRQ